MRNKGVLGMGILVAAGAVWLIVSGLGEGTTYYFHVREVLAGKPPPEARFIRVSGTAVPASTTFDAKTGDLLFQLRDHQTSATLLVRYKGLRPENFREGKALVAEGRYDAKAGVFVSTALILKCPSKYEKP